MSWIRLDEAIFTDDWYANLSEPCKVAWLHFLLLAKRNRGRVGTCSPKLLAQNIQTTQNAAQEMLESALKNGNLLLEEGKSWKVKNWSKYQEDQTNSERQANHRENVSNGKQRYSPLRNENNADGTIQDNTIQIISPNGEINGHPQTDDPVHAACHNLAREWNEVACKQTPAIKPITLPVSKRRYQHLRARLGQPALLAAWQSGDLWKAIAEQKFLHGQNQRGWILTFDKLVERQGIFEGVIERKYANGPPGKTAADSDADRHKEARNQLEKW